MVRTLAALLVLTATAYADRAFVAAGTEQPRAHRNVSYAEAAGWKQMMDADTHVPLRMWGPSLPVFGAIASPQVAENAARVFLAEHLGLLAPGAVLADFTVISNERRGEIRTIGFAQSSQGVSVLGGSVAVTFERDHLVMVGSTALPNVSVHVPAGTLGGATLEAAAIGFVRERVVSHGARTIVPLIFSKKISYRLAETVRLERDDVFVDANDATPIARLSRVAYGTGSVLFDTPDRYPAAGRSAKLAPNATHIVDGVPVTSDANGDVTWPGTAPASVSPTTTGPLTTVSTVTGTTVADLLSLANNSSVTWSHADDPSLDAQLDAFVFASQAKTFAATKLDPSLAWLTEQTQVFVNDTSGTCNAYSSDDNSLHFYSENAMCENTARIADVVYHEFGHSVHRTSVIPGVGAFDPSASEGYADTLCVSITGDHGMGRGFFYTDAPLRDLDPVGIEKRWPDDADGDPHDEGQIIGETLYDLRKALQTKYGTDAGFALFLHIYDGELQRSVDIPSTYAEATLADDDDGDLSNGVPDECEINAAFALHGLTTPDVTLGLVPPTLVGNTVSLVVHPPAHDNAACPFGVASVTLSWKSRDIAGIGGDLAMTSTGNDTYSVDLPQQPDGSVVLYHVTLLTNDGSKKVYPDNGADPDYQKYFGPVTTLACFDFESGLEGWTHLAAQPPNDEWEVGAPEGLSSDPSTAHGGANVLGIDLDHDGAYKPSTDQRAVSPAIDLQGYANVRLQYYRWLSVRDGAQDKATIEANAIAVWANFASPSAMQPLLIPHVDKEWRFQDVDLTSAIAGAPTATITFDLASTRGGADGGWTVDDVCLVATSTPAICGNGIVEPGETCDDGNVAAGDGCSATCQTETTPPAMSSGGCCSTGTSGSSAILLALATLGLMFKKSRFNEPATVASLRCDTLVPQGGNPLSCSAPWSRCDTRC